jgi:hypothetical protein
MGKPTNDVLPRPATRIRPPVVAGVNCSSFEAPQKNSTAIVNRSHGMATA